MNTVNQWLYDHLQQWTPFSVMVLVAVAFCVFVGIWDTVRGIDIPNFVIGILSIILGGTGATSLFSHGVAVANGVAASTAKAVIEQQQQGSTQNATQEGQK